MTGNYRNKASINQIAFENKTSKQIYLMFYNFIKEIGLENFILLQT